MMLLRMCNMRKNFFFIIFLYVTFYGYSQTWVVDGKEVGVEGIDYEYTIISKTQFERILKANEQTSSYVQLDYVDNIQMIDTKVKKGTRPELNGYYFLSGRGIPKTDLWRLAISYIKSMLLYGNSKTGVMTIIFWNTYIPGSISLEFERDDYNKKFNQLLSIINSE